jgi:hypothetical protein
MDIEAENPISTGIGRSVSLATLELLKLPSSIPISLGHRLRREPPSSALGLGSVGLHSPS